MGLVVIIFHGFGIQVTFKQLASAQILIGGNLLLPLERRMGLGHKECGSHMHTKSPLLIGCMLLPAQDHLMHKLGNTKYILVRLRGKTQHKVQLYIVPATCKSDAAG